METKSISRRVVVTGASSGIGEATARGLSEQGWSVIGVARRADRLEALASETGCEVVVADITVDADVEKIRNYVVETGGLSALVNVAGLAIGSDTVGTASPADWQTMFDVNVLGTQRMIAALLPELRKHCVAGAHADIVTISSTAGFVSYEGGGGYNASKFALHGALGALRLELAGEPIRVVEIAPGMVKTPEFILKRLEGDVERMKAWYEGVEGPLTAEDVAGVVAYALSLPGHINLDLVTMKPVAQAAQHKIHRGALAPKSE
jgi:NADP-dependent 3-hydroxy acid dehydrogenase YdfG